MSDGRKKRNISIYSVLSRSTSKIKVSYLSIGLARACACCMASLLWNFCRFFFDSQTDIGHVMSPDIHPGESGLFFPSLFRSVFSVPYVGTYRGLREKTGVCREPTKAWAASIAISLELAEQIRRRYLPVLPLSTSTAATAERRKY